MKLLYVGYRDPRHSKFGGYDWITKFPNSDYLEDKKAFFNMIKFGTSGKFINLFFLDCLSRFYAPRYDVVHFFYGDLTIFKPFRKKRNYKVVATIHLNTENIEKHHKNIKKCIKSCDAIIVLNSQQCTFLREKYRINSFFIPHGFNKPVFSYKDVSMFEKNYDKNIINIVTIGKQYRDYETLLDVIENYKNNTVFHFWLVGISKDWIVRFEQYANTTVCKRLDDDEYYSLISACDYLFLPLTFATANNALMEAQFLGVPSILPKINGVLDYACNEVNLFYSNQKDLHRIFDSLTKTKKSIILQNYSELFSWDNIFRRLKEVYKTL